MRERTTPSRNTKKVVGVGIVLAAGGFLALNAHVPDEPEPSASVADEQRQADADGTHDARFWNEFQFSDAVQNVKDVPSGTFDNVKGAIIPHHLLASDLIARLFQQIDTDGIERVILIGPNHYRRGETAFITSAYNWDTPVGEVSVDADAVARLAERNPEVSVNEPVTVDEHSVAGIMPFIAHYIPDARVVPLVVASSASLEQINSIVADIRGIQDERTLVIASVDFAHHQTQEEAEERDKETIALLRDGNVAGLRSLDSRYVDSPNSLAILFGLMDEEGASLRITQNSNSGELLDEPYSEVTSYILGVFEKSE